MSSSSSTSLKKPLATLRASSSRDVTALEAVLLTGDAGGSEPLDIGDEVELVPRLLHEGGGRPQYFWKVRPVRQVAPDGADEIPEA